MGPACEGLDAAQEEVWGLLMGLCTCWFLQQHSFPFSAYSSLPVPQCPAYVLPPSGSPL